MAPAVLVEWKGPDPVRNVVPIAARDLADQNRRLAAAKRGVEGAHQQLRGLATVPFEVGQEDELAVVIGNTRHAGMKAIAGNAEWNDMHRPARTAGRPGLPP